MIASTTRHHAPTSRRRPGPLGVLGWLVTGAAGLVRRLGQALMASAVLAGLGAALPWALWHFIGWPLPDHLPTGAEVAAVLLGPLSTPLLLDLLACLCWITWAAFVIDVARCVFAAARGLRWPELPTAGPVHALAAILVGIIVVALLGNRSPTAAAIGITEAASGGGQVIATATVTTPAPVDPIAMVCTTPAAPISQDADSVVVRAPENGIHDSLSRIAARTLGAAGRWPEIFALNKGKPQPHGGTLTNPNLIYPGERLTLPSPTPPPAASTDHPAASPAVPGPPSPSLSDSIPGPSTTTPGPLPSPTVSRTAPAPSVLPAFPTNSTPGSGPGIDRRPGVFVGVGLAAAISAALVIARRRHRRRYRPGSGHRDELPVAPVVYQLRLAHLRAEHTTTCQDPDPDDEERDRWQVSRLIISEDPHSSPGDSPQRPVTPGLGVRDGQEITLDLAAARGLGLVGEGALAAARALLLALLSPLPASAVTPLVIIPAGDLALLLGAEHARLVCPSAVQVVADLDAALDELETEMLRRVREADSGAATRVVWPVLALVARPPAQHTRRLQAVLDNGAPVGLVGVLLGQWRPGRSAYVRHDGTVSSVSPGPGQALLGTRMFHLPETETAQLLELLRQAQSEDSEPPAPDLAAPLTPGVRGAKDSPPASTEPPAVDQLTATLDACQGTGEAGDTALELTAIPRAEPDDLSEPRRVRPDGDDHHPAHEPDGQPPQQPSAADSSHPAAPKESAPHDALAAPITITVLGCPRVHWTPESTGETGTTGAETEAVVREITAAFPPRQRELLVFLALHPNGVHRETLVAALWQDNPPQRPTNALNTALSRLRRAVSQATDGAISDLITTGENRYHLDPRVVTVDYWRFSDAVAARRAAPSEGQRIAAYQRIVEGYHGCLAEGLDTEWIEAPREAIRRDALDAVAALARALIEAEPQQTLDLLETARAFDPHNELLYRDIMRLQHRLGHLDAIPRTLSLLSTRLAEIDETPTAQALGLAAHLQQRPDTEHPIHGAPGRHDRRGEQRNTAAVH